MSKNGLDVTDKPLIFIAGPTAVGKSALAIQIAKNHSGELINLDSVQIYEDFVIGAAQPTELQKQIVPHHLFGVLSPTEKISVGKYLKLFTPLEKSILENKKLPILVGGTSLYLTGVLYGLADLPEDVELRKEIELLATEQIFQELTAAVTEEKLLALQIHPNDRVRLARALEVVRLGEDIEMTRVTHKETLPRQGLVIVPILDRDKLYKRINQRTDCMLKDGLLDEVKNIRLKWGDVSPLRSIGYKESVSFLDSEGIKTEKELCDLISMNTRRFAKRQMTWLRNEPRKRGWNIEPGLQGKVFEWLDIDAEQLQVKIQQYLENPQQFWHFPVSIWFVPAEKML